MHASTKTKLEFPLIDFPSNLYTIFTGNHHIELRPVGLREDGTVFEAKKHCVEAGFCYVLEDTEDVRSFYDLEYSAHPTREPYEPNYSHLDGTNFVARVIDNKIHLESGKVTIHTDVGELCLEHSESEQLNDNGLPTFFSIALFATVPVRKLFQRSELPVQELCDSICSSAKYRNRELKEDPRRGSYDLNACYEEYQAKLLKRYEEKR